MFTKKQIRDAAVPIPNALTQQAMRDARAGIDVTRHDSLDDVFADLDTEPTSGRRKATVRKMNANDPAVRELRLQQVRDEYEAARVALLDRPKMVFSVDSNWIGGGCVPSVRSTMRVSYPPIVEMTVEQWTVSYPPRLNVMICVMQPVTTSLPETLGSSTANAHSCGGSYKTTIKSRRTAMKIPTPKNLIEHLTTMFADPHTADITDIWVDDDGLVLYMIDVLPDQCDEDGNVPTIGRLLSFLPEETLAVLRKRLILETEWEDEDGNPVDPKELL